MEGLGFKFEVLCLGSSSFGLSCNGHILTNSQTFSKNLRTQAGCNVS